MTTNHIKLACPPFAICYNHGYSVQPTEQSPSHTSLETALQPSGNHQSLGKMGIPWLAACGCWRLMTVARKMIGKVTDTQAYRSVSDYGKYIFPNWLAKTFLLLVFLFLHSTFFNKRLPRKLWFYHIQYGG